MSDRTFYFIMGAVYGPLTIMVFKTFFTSWKWFRKNRMETVLKDLIDKDWTTKDAIIALVREKIEKDWQMQKVITDLLIEKAGNDWQLQQAIRKAANKTA